MMRSGILVAAAAVFFSGCSGEGTIDRKPVYSVSGKVTLSGSAPISGATVSFAPQEGQPVAVGRTGDDGTFKVTTYEFGDGAAEGKYDILISKSVSTSAAATPEEGHAAMAAGGPPPSHDAKAKGSKDEGAMVNPKYGKAGSGLTATVTKDGPNEFTFDLDP